MRIALLLYSLVLACGGETSGPVPPPPPPPTPPAGNAVDVNDNAFNPTSRQVTVGATVTWTWRGGNAHNVTFTGGTPASPTQATGTYQQTFGALGTYDYQCTVHGSAMSGSVVVVAAGQ